MPRLIVIEGHEGQRRQLSEQLAALEKAGYPLAGKFESGDVFSSSGWRGLFEQAGGRGLFAERQVLVSEGSEALGPFPDELAELLEGEESEAVIIALFTGDTKKIFSKGVLAQKKILFIKAEAAVPPWKRKDWLLGLAREKGYRLTAEAAGLLAESIESQEELRGELEKLGLYTHTGTGTEGRDIGAEDVRLLSFDEGGRAQLTFLDGVCQADAQSVERALKHLRPGPLLPVLTALCNRLRPALYLSSFPRSPDEALKAIGMGSGKDYALRGARNALRAFGPGPVKRFLLMAIRLSFLEKTSRSEGWPGFELVLWDLMGSVGRSRHP